MEAELASIDDVVSKIMWTKVFLETQGYEIRENLVYCDNPSWNKWQVEFFKKNWTFYPQVFLYYSLDWKSRGINQRLSIQCHDADYTSKPFANVSKIETTGK